MKTYGANQPRHLGNLDKRMKVVLLGTDHQIHSTHILDSGFTFTSIAQKVAEYNETFDACFKSNRQSLVVRLRSSVGVQAARWSAMSVPPAGRSARGELARGTESAVFGR